MPVYRYRCPSCETIHEVLHNMNAQHVETCECGETMRKLIGSPPAIYKCKGFYATRPLKPGEKK